MEPKLLQQLYKANYLSVEYPGWPKCVYRYYLVHRKCSNTANGLSVLIFVRNRSHTLHNSMKFHILLQKASISAILEVVRPTNSSKYPCSGRIFKKYLGFSVFTHQRKISEIFSI